jgi:hypothetical protein
MSLATSLRTFLRDMEGHDFVQVYQEKVPQGANSNIGYVWFNRRSTTKALTMERTIGGPDGEFFDIEVYHPDINKVEQFSNVLHDMTCYRGAFGDGTIQGLFVTDQTDDYVPQVSMTDTEKLSTAFLSIEVRSYRESN